MISEAIVGEIVAGLIVTSLILWKLLIVFPFTVAVAVTKYLPGYLKMCEAIYSFPDKWVAVEV
ncbi:MAG: hypothetical protein ACP5T1_07245, partial [Thermoplasmata archaeon]